jgi:hypothetical protein
LQRPSDIEIPDLIYLEASTAAGNFTRAAKSLRINASTVSRRVGRFEDGLDARSGHPDIPIKQDHHLCAFRFA